MSRPAKDEKDRAANTHIGSGTSLFATKTIYFYMNDGDQRVRCGITRLALEILEPELAATKQGRIQAFNHHRTGIEQAAGAGANLDAALWSPMAVPSL
jgi:hypothetical protein